MPPQGGPLPQRWAMSPRREFKSMLLERGKKSVQGITKSTSMHADLVALLFDILHGAVSAEDGPLPSRSAMHTCAITMTTTDPLELD